MPFATNEYFIEFLLNEDISNKDIGGNSHDSDDIDDNYESDDNDFIIDLDNMVGEPDIDME